jgi:prepilin-type N-terminal cleavage/methylation domain-containing protein
MKKTNKKHQEGLTLIELLIGITISSLIFLVSTSLVAALFSTNTKQKYQESLEQVKNDLTSEFSTNVRWGKSIKVASNELTVDDIKYTLRDSRIYKGSNPLTPADVDIERFEIKNYSTTATEVSIEIDISMQHKTYNSAQDVLKIVVSQRKHELSEDEK